MGALCVQLEIGNQIFEGVANLIYDCLNWRLQHQHYLDNMELFSVPTVVVMDAEPAEVHIYTHISQYTYQQTVQSVPCTTVHWGCCSGATLHKALFIGSKIDTVTPVKYI